MTLIKGKIPGKRVAEVRLDGECIAGILTPDSTRNDQRLPDEDIRITAGFIDIQVNGFAGVDFNHPNFSGDDLVGVCRNLLTTGVTRFCPTLITADYKRIARNIKEIRQACKRHPLVGSMVLGIHLEGPYINPEDGPRGAHPRAHVVRPDWDERAIVEQIWNDLQGTIERSTIRQELTQVIPRFQNARIEIYIPIFLRRVTIERLRAGVAGVVPTGTVEPTEASPTLVPDTTGATMAPSR